MPLIILFVSFFMLAFPNTLYADTLKTGDIILRQENTYLSKLFAAIENSSYAHAGVILKRNGKSYIVHVEMAEGEDGLRVQEWKEFLKNAERWKVLRLKNPMEKDQFDRILNKYIKLKPSFNLDFTEGKKGSLYCTEFIQVIYKEATGITLAKTRSSFKGKVFIGTNDIYSSPLLIEIVSKP